MGTRGTTGFIIDGERKSNYQQYDSYPSGVGVAVLAFARKVANPTENGMDIEQVHKLARELKIVDADDKPTADDLKLIGDTYLSSAVSSGDDWYAYLRHAQGNPAAILDSGYVAGHEIFQAEEYDYIINFDTRELVVYAGMFVLGRFGFDSLPSDEEFVSKTKD